MRARPTLLSIVFTSAAAVLFVLARTEAPIGDGALLGPARTLAPGISLYHVTASSLLDPPAPVSAWVLRLDPALASIRPALAHDRIMDTETVGAMGGRHKALAAINGGFFLPSGDPSGIYKLDGQLVSEARRPRGAVGIALEEGRPRLIFGRVSVRVAMRVYSGNKPAGRVEITGIDTTRLLGRLMLFTPAYYRHTDTAPGGLEWVVTGSPLRVASGPHGGGKTPIPADGYVLSFGGRKAPPPLAALTRGARIKLETTYESVNGDQDWSQAHHIIGGAGLLMRDSRSVESWAIESFAAGFAELRHPRTMIGTGPDASIWLAVVDGRQPDLSAGMTLVELREFARRLALTNALNLDGGGSTTMWVNGAVVNSPSDPTGPRAVSDALLVFPGTSAD